MPDCSFFRVKRLDTVSSYIPGIISSMLSTNRNIVSLDTPLYNQVRLLWLQFSSNAEMLIRWLKITLTTKTPKKTLLMLIGSLLTNAALQSLCLMIEKASHLWVHGGGLFLTHGRRSTYHSQSLPSTSLRIEATIDSALTTRQGAT